MQHRCRPVRCRRRWFAFALTAVSVSYGATDLERRRHVHVFEVAVVDHALGGTSRGRVAVRGDTLVGFDPDVEVSGHSLDAAN